MRDMSKREFENAVARHGFKSEGFMGYYRLNVPRHVCVSILNAGTNRRAQLAYLLQKQEQEEKRLADKAAEQAFERMELDWRDAEAGTR